MTEIDVARPPDALEELARSLRRVNLLMDACDAWLRDPQDPERYDLGPRSTEVIITYEDVDEQGKPTKARATLAELMARINGLYTIVDVDRTIADPRTLILKTAQELRLTVTAAADLVRMLADARALQQFRDALLAEIAKVDESIARRIAEAIRPVLVVYAVDAGHDALLPERK